MRSFDDFLAEQMQDPEFKAEWDRLKPEFEKIRESIEKQRSK